MPDVSLCVITKDEPYLQKALESIRPHVKQIVVVLTGGQLSAAERKLIDTFEEFPAINTELDCFDFSMARNRSFALATEPVVMWMDADDEIVGGEHLQAVTATLHGPLDQIMCPYEYTYDHRGVCTFRLYRERIMLNNRVWKWDGAVHEAIIPVGNRREVDSIVWKHRKSGESAGKSYNRNMTILRKMAEKGTDARHIFYLGVACADGCKDDEAITHLTHFAEIAGWDDERHNACIRLVECHLRQNKVPDALRWAYAAMDAKPAWSESYFALARCYYVRADQTKNREDWARAVHFGELGLTMPPTQTTMFIKPLERTHEIYTYLIRAYDNLGEYKKALDAANKALEAVPDDGGVLFNRALMRSVIERGVFLDTARRFVSWLGEYDAVDKILNETFTELRGLIPAPPKPRRAVTDVSSRLDIVFACGDGWGEVWNPDVLKEKGFGGGSELAVVEMARRLWLRGHRVRVFNKCGAAKTYEGVEYLPSDQMGGECDVVIAWRVASHLKRFDAHVRLLWLHDVYAYGSQANGQATKEELEYADKILCVSAWHKSFVAQHHGISPEKIIQTRNGIASPERFRQDVKRIATKAVYNSSPDRGLNQLLEIWPGIRRSVPDAELHVFYGFEMWKKMGHNREEREALFQLMETTQGVRYRGRVPPEELAREMLSANSWLYPTTFSEVSAVAAMEAQLAGMRIVYMPVAALPETIGDRGVQANDLMAFRGAAIDSFNPTSKMFPDRTEMMEYAAKAFSLDVLAKDWEDMFFDWMTERMIPKFVSAL